MVHDIPRLIQHRGGNVKFIQSLDDHFNGGHNDHSNEVRFPAHAPIALLPFLILILIINNSHLTIFLTCIPLLEQPINLKRK